MLSDVPVVRLLDGVAASLRTYVLPHVTDPFALMQLRAIDEVLSNLAERVDWSYEEVNEETDGIEALLALLRQAGWSGSPLPSDTQAGSQVGSASSGAVALHRRSEALHSLRDALTWVEQSTPRDATAVAVRPEAVDCLRTAIARERALLRSGMFA